jgi:hypothetical protein
LEMKAWIKARVDKKDVAPDVQPEEYGKSFMKWWTVLQPSWRKMDDGRLTKDTPDGEKWGGLLKGGTAGIYTVVVALSWWIKALGTVAEGGEAFLAVRDVAWVLEQASGTLRSERGSWVGSEGLKRVRDESPEGTRNKKR